MLAPFEVDARDVENLTETLKEEIETFFYGNTEPPSLGFTGVGVYEYKRKNLLYLNPHYGADLNFCSEMIIDICRTFISKHIHYKENKKQFLPLGIFNNLNELHLVLENAKIEFENNSELPIVSISLYESKMGIWFEKEVLVNFEENIGLFLQRPRASL